MTETKKKLRPWDDGHQHRWVYYSGMASCQYCAATVDPGGKVSKPTRSSKAHRREALEE